MIPAYEMSHARRVFAAALLFEGREAGRIVAQFTDRREGIACTATVTVYRGPLGGLSTGTGRCGGGGSDKLSGAIAAALRDANRPGRPLGIRCSAADLDRRIAAAEVLSRAPDLDGRGWGECRRWLESLGYQVVEVLSR